MSDVDAFAEAVRKLVGSGRVPQWPAGAAIPPMPEMVDCGDGFSMSVEALGHFARAGDEKAIRVLAAANIEWDRVHWTQREQP
jgi:hypothetical protein